MMRSSLSLGQDPRIVSLVPSTDFVNTTPYTGPGIDPTGGLLDLLIGVSPQLTRSLMELSLVKTENSLRHLSSQQATVIQSVGLGSTQIYVDHLRPMFNMVNEDNVTPLEPDYQNSIRFNTQTVVVGAAGTASVGVRWNDH